MNEQKYLKSIAESLYGIRKELIKLNQSNPTTQAQSKPEKKKKPIEPKNFI
ncbi:hypothetical protein [Staphylococcus chromogenes]|uniref:hypothetical protein n=1 Tax=Staphylococcus chromogenes TaxID=46126 RepID=UPI0028FEE461|nr:hypothetical protein [Staphylococcus chromogenes]MDU0479919.1 hypothetical protein [Staphylococcus chromogenes]